MHTINPTLDFLSDRSGRKATMSWQSVPKLKGGKNNAQQGLVRKVSTAQVTLSGTGVYAMRKVTEGEFQSVTDVQERKWGTRRGNSCVVDHKGAEYVEFLVDGKPETTYFLGDNPIDKEDIVGLNSRDSDSAVRICCVKAATVLAYSDPVESDD